MDLAPALGSNQRQGLDPHQRQGLEQEVGLQRVKLNGKIILSKNKSTFSLSFIPRV